MLKSQVHHSLSVQTPIFPRLVSFASGYGRTSFPVRRKPGFSTKHNTKIRRFRDTHRNIKAITKTPATATETSTTVKAVATVEGKVDLLRKTLILELVAAEVDPKTGLEKETIKGIAHKASPDETSPDETDVKYELEFTVPEDFGEIGGVLVENEHDNETYLKNIALDGFPNGTINVTCNSWVHSKSDNPEKRIFFTNKSYLPSQTPSGVKKLREKELTNLRGDGEGERKAYERIYDYDVYNDVGGPDSSDELKRPVLGGKEHPYPRRCRTGRPRSETDQSSEKRSSSPYVPRDEAFFEKKSRAFSTKIMMYSRLHALIPSQTVDSNPGFPNFMAIDILFGEEIGLQLKTISALVNQLLKLAANWTALNMLLKKVTAVTDFVRDFENSVLLFKPPEMIQRDMFSWFRDEEFCRQTLAGLNPCSIRLVTAQEWPLKSKLDPKVYGPPESAITKQLVEQEIRGFMTIEEAVEQKKLFMLDYHDLLLPYVNKVRETEGTTLYGSRTLFFLTPEGTLRALAIELTRPPSNGKPQWKQVFTPCWDATRTWLWKLAKAHVLAHDSGYHQLVSHWLRTHCATEPYIIASNRQLSAMHPIYRLLHPHWRYTMKINAFAREALINANGIIESSFSLGKYSIEFSSVAYDQQWSFDLQALPADLINRGMAVEDPTAPHGVKLTIEDYPFASDGLVLWDTIKHWVSDYVNHYYPQPSLVESDPELQAWWKEIRTVGHGDKKDEPWWPVLKTPQDLIGILTTMIWITSGHHSAVNFGQYAYAGYFPNRPTIARTKMPTEDPSDEEWKSFEEKPESRLLSCFPSQIQATKIMAILDVLSDHSPDEEYIGEIIEPSWAENPIIKAAFEEFNGRLKELEGIIDARNADKSLKNRTGAGVVPYELMKPVSEPGVTAKGVPNSISI